MHPFFPPSEISARTAKIQLEDPDKRGACECVTLTASESKSGERAKPFVVLSRENGT